MGTGHDAKTDHVYRFLNRRPDDLFNGLMETGINNLHTGISEGQRNHLGTAVMSI